MENDMMVTLFVQLLKELEEELNLTPEELLLSAFTINDALDNSLKVGDVLRSE